MMRRSSIRLALLALCGLLLSPLGHARDDNLESGQELLNPEQAFRVEARMTSPDSLAVTWRIADGHYMYRQRFSLQSADARVALGDPAYPRGETKQDEFFGEMEIYESDVTFTVPVTTLSGGVDEFTVEATGQGCNEPVGICYPPVTRTLTVQPVRELSGLSQSRLGASTVDEPAGDLQALLDPNGANREEFLPPDEAFSFEFSALGATTMLARFSIEPGYYLYKDKFSVTSNDPGIEVAATRLPAGVRKTDEYFGETYAFYDAFDAEVSLRRSGEQARTASFTVSYQGCAEDGICYPPIEKQVSVRLPGLSDAIAAGPGGEGGAGGFHSGYWPILLAFGSGLLLTFTPCVLPMIPILGGIIVGQGMNRRGGVTRLRGGSLAVVYVLGTAVTYTAVGVVAGLTGDQLQAYFQNIWTIGLVAALLVLMALSMFGFYELSMPSALQTRVQNRATGLKAGAFGGVFLMGMLSALIVGACVSPILISILGLAINRGDPVLGGLIMFAMALGMGLFLVAMGFGFGQLLPRAGAWMERVKHAFGIMLIGVAIYLLGAIPAVPVMYLWAALLIGTAFYIAGAGFLKDTGSRRSLWQAAAFLFFGWGVLAAVGGLQGNRNILHPVDVQALTGGEPSAAHAEFRRVTDPAVLSSLMETARADGKPVMIDYYADWCVDCVRMERSTFSSPKVAGVLKDEFMLIQVDVTDPNDPGTRAIKQSHGIFGPPAMLFFDRHGNEARDLRRYGYMDDEAFLDHIARLRQG